MLNIIRVWEVVDLFSILAPRPRSHHNGDEGRSKVRFHGSSAMPSQYLLSDLLASGSTVMADSDATDTPEYQFTINFAMHQERN